MAVRAGFKQTEVGVIPEDWKIETLGQMTTLMTNGFVGPVIQHYDESGNGVLYIQGYNVEENSFNFHGIKYVTEEFHRAHMKSSLHEGDLLTIQTGEVGLTTIVPETLAGANCHALIISRFDKNYYFPHYVSFYLNSKPGRARLRLIETGTTMKHLNVGDMLHFTVPLPPTLAEQKAIAAALSDADTLIAALEALIAKKRQIKQGAMQELLSVESGEWRVKSFDDVLLRINAKAYQISASDYQSSGKYPVIDQGKLPIIGYSDEDKYFECPNGGVIVFGDHTCIVKYVDFNFLIGADGTQVLIAKDGYDTRFFAFQLQHKGITPTGYNRHFKFLKEREFLVPPLPVQTAIAEILSDMDAEIDMLAAKLSKARQVKQGMISELLTGRVRLVNSGELIVNSEKREREK